MSDRFKFRVWVKDTKEYHYHGVTFLADVINDDNYVVEQCTGLKDKNGKLIYEGDIVRESPYNKYFEYADYVISWKDGAYTTEQCLGMKNKETGEIKDCSKGGYCFSKHIHQEAADDFEIIGNIHEERQNG